MKKLSKSTTNQIEYVDKLESFQGGSKAEIKWLGDTWHGWLNGELVVNSAGITDAIEAMMAQEPNSQWYYKVSGTKIKFTSRPPEE